MFFSFTLRLCASVLALSSVVSVVSGLTIPLKPRNNDGEISVLSHDIGAKEIVYSLGDSYYFTPTGDTRASFTSGDVSLTGPLPITAITLDTSSASAEGVKALLEGYLSNDDVLTEDFLSTLLMVSSGGSLSLSPDVTSYLTSKGVKTIILGGGISVETTSGPSVKYADSPSAKDIAGPYIAMTEGSTTTLYPVYKLEVDRYRTFVHGVYPLNGSFATFDKVTSEFGDPYIPIPSRLYSDDSDGPLAGQRMAIKDIYDVKGVQTAAGNRAFAELYPVAANSAPAVDKLLSFGAVIVGKTKTAQFASGASTNDATLEVQYPFSPRSDLWQSCAASSSGSGCAMAAYSWLDFALGTDTGGSVRIPAAISGLYGIRPTSGAISLDSVIPISPTFDTLGVLARDPKQWTQILRLWYVGDLSANFQYYPSFPKKLIYPTNYNPIGSPEGKAIKESFISMLQSRYSMERVELNFTQAVLDSGRVPSVINNASSQINGWWQWNTIGRDLVDRYAAANDGRFPPLDSARRDNFQLWRANRTQAGYDESIPIINDYRDWFNNEFFKYDQETCSDAIYVYDVGTGGWPAYREAILNNGRDAFTPFVDPLNNTITNSQVSPLGGNVDITIPIGQAAYNSTVSLTQEYHPVTISLMSRAGCDFMLLKMVDDLADAGLIHSVKTGRTAF